MGQQKIKRIFHKWDKWECYPAGFYEERFHLSDEECKKEYAKFLSNLPRFEAALARLTYEWKNSCEHYLTNEKMNRIAWLGQAAMCIDTGIPSKHRAGYFMMQKEKQQEADEMALKWLNVWLVRNNYSTVDLIGAGVKVHANIY